MGVVVAWVGIAIADDPPTSVGGVTYRHDLADVAPPGSFSVDVTCPGGTHLSGGVSFSESGTQGAVQSTAPIDGPDADRRPDDSWRGRHYFSASESPQSLNDYVICLGGGLTYALRSTVVHPGTAGAVTVSCGRDRHVVGGGAALPGAGAGSYVNSTYPWDSADRGAIPDDGWTSRAFNNGGSDLRLNSYATCSRTSQTYWEALQSIAPGSGGFAHSGCPAAQHLVGAGARLFGPADEAVFTGAAIGDGPDADAAPDDTVDAGERVAGFAPASRSIEAFAVCRR